jgi:hypothetical protein
MAQGVNSFLKVTLSTSGADAASWGSSGVASFFDQGLRQGCVCEGVSFFVFLSALFVV